MTVPRHDTDASRREQELCVNALETGDFDEMSDQEWVAMCERIAREAAESGQVAVDASTEAVTSARS